MADQGQFLDPRDERAIQQDTGPGLADRWRGWLAQPQNQAFLMQAGAALLQSRPEGQTALGQFGGALGAGGEAAARVARQEEEREENVSKQRLREQTGEASQMRGEAAMLRGQAAMERAAMVAEGGGRPMTEGQRMQMRMRAQGKYKDWIVKSEDPLNEPLLKILGAKSKEEVDTTPELKKRAIDWFMEGAPEATPARPRSNMTPVPGNSRIMGTAEGVASGAYNSTLVSQAVEAIYSGQPRERVLQQYENMTGRSRQDVLGQL